MLASQALLLIVLDPVLQVLSKSLEDVTQADSGLALRLEMKLRFKTEDEDLDED